MNEVTTAQMKELERLADAAGLPYLRMMENAGTAAARELMARVPGLKAAAVFCGSEKMPPPTIEPTTNAVKAPRRSLLFAVFRARSSSSSSQASGSASCRMSSISIVCVG